MSPPMRWTVLIVMAVILLGVDAGRYNWRYTRMAVDSVEKAVTWTINAGRGFFADKRSHGEWIATDALTE